jgi:outer membrane protein OmpA-like peptidoglycan-associated protein
MDYLVGAGVSADRLTTISLGETQPKHDNSQETSRRLNRRVQLVPKDQR